MIRNAFQTPEIAYAAISIGFSVCLVFVLFVFFQSKRTNRTHQENRPEEKNYE